jgi:hypothetical protein
MGWKDFVTELRNKQREMHLAGNLLYLGLPWIWSRDSGNSEVDEVELRFLRLLPTKNSLCYTTLNW